MKYELTPKDEADYVADKGRHCPFCGSRAMVVVESDIASQLVTCEICEAEWYNIYKLVGVEVKTPPTKKNISIQYLYRDASNFKAYTEVVFSNPHSLEIESIRTAIIDNCHEKQWFNATQVRLPEVFLFNVYPVCKDDHCWHELDVIKETPEKPTDALYRTISQFIAEMRQASLDGWVQFDPTQGES